ncbi:Prephenate dehydratase-domain-containing protein [Xylariaceae sp. FL0255]|nr:Prephenate dehydratase-domain-containing protein [Xylariaceae sp. FL0255]
MTSSQQGVAHMASVGSKLRVCFLGPVASYTHQATLKAFPADRYDLIPVTTIKDIFDTTNSGTADYGVVPFENSTNGSVVFTLDNFADRDGVYGELNVCREIYLDVHHCLLGRKPRSTSTGAGEEDLSRIRRIYSHPQAFGQCTKFLRSRLRGIETVDVSSTSRAAELAAQDTSGESAAISSAAAAELVGIDALVKNIEDRSDNTTRFFVLRKGTETPILASGNGPGSLERLTAAEGGEGEGEEADKILLAKTKSLLSFTVPHRSPGALADVLSCFRRGGLNLTSINSRPALSSPSPSAPGTGSTTAASFEYVFFVEFEGHRFIDRRGRVAGVLAEVASVARTSRWLGSWENMLVASTKNAA